MYPFKIASWFVTGILLALINTGQMAHGQFGGGSFEKEVNQQPQGPDPAIAEKPKLCGSMSPVPESAVTKGSFTVWTVPEDPMPGQQYAIMIQLKVSEKLERYPRCDIAGSVQGTDGYKDFFGGPTEPGYYGVKDQRVRFEVMVPGAAKLVEDVIHVKSKVLNEEQEIKLKF